MPLEDDANIGAKTREGTVCKFCVDSAGNIKACEEIFEGGVQFFINTISDTNRDLAERITRKNMLKLPYWQNRDCECLKGTVATDEEFQIALAKIQGMQ